MSDIAVKVENLSKLYHIGALQEQYPTLRSALVSGIKRLTTRRSAQNTGENTIWALKDVSFDIKQGEVVGIIGRNGAGKSTLLKVLAHITEPTKGRVSLYGRVGSLLEVGTGFHPELTGRDNIYLNGAILGMKRVEIQHKFDEIVAFSEIEKFLDTPVKRYSSGMYVRLAFAVAAHLEPEILVVDEVLAVGDAEFQKKCLGKMGEVAHEGRTVLFVSHNMGAVNSLCSTVIWLEKGRVVSIGQSKELISRYVSDGRSLNSEVTWLDVESAPGNKNIRLKAVRVLSEGLTTSEPRIDREIIIEVEYWNLVPGAVLYNSVQLRDHSGGLIFASVNWPSAIIGVDFWAGRPRPAGAYCSRMVIPPNWLNSNTYSIDIGIADGSNRWQEDLGGSNVLSFTAIDIGEMRKEYVGPWAGTIRPKFSWSTVSIAETDKNGT